jgi:uncharacterized protein (DUF427 family)
MSVFLSAMERSGAAGCSPSGWPVSPPQDRPRLYLAAMCGHPHLSQDDSEEDDMSDRAVLIPGPDHPITIEKEGGHILVKIGETVLADTRAALTLREARYPAILYIPREDVAMEHLVRSDHASYCPYKGEASYFHIPSLGARSDNAVWSYEAPYEAVSPIRDHLAFYADRVMIEEMSDAAISA